MWPFKDKNEIQHTLTNDSICVILGGTPHTVQKGSANYEALRKALFEKNWAAVPDLVTVAKTVENWVRGDFKVQGDSILYKGKALPTGLNSRILKMVTAGNPPEGLLRFWERLQLNPSWRSVNQLFPFLEHEGIPIDKDGYFLAYKGVKADYKDVHSGTIDNTPGLPPIEFPRNEISDDPNEACHKGLHVGALKYARDFGVRTIICKVDPADVVCIPYDAASMKMRVCKYQVIGNYGGKLHDTVYDEADSPKLEPKPKAEVTAKVVEPETGKPMKGKAKVIKEVPAPVVFAPVPGQPDFSKLDEGELNQVLLGDLRSYAAHVLKIVGASKIPGGKPVLVQRILETRDGVRL